MQSVMHYVRNAARTPFAAALAMLAVLSGLRGWLEPETLPLVEVLGTATGYAWATVYGIGGLLMLYGMSAMKSKFEAAGCVLFGGGTFIQAFATAFFLGRAPYLTFWSMLTLLIFTAAAAIRAAHLTRGQVLVWLDPHIKNNHKEEA